MRKIFFHYALFYVTFILAPGTSNAQNAKKSDREDKLIFGTSLTLRNEGEEGFPDNIIYRDLTWNINAAFQFSRRFRVGAAAMPIFKKRFREDWENFFMAGAFLQFDVLPKDRSPIILEAGIFRGNFVPMSDDIIEKKGMYYLDFGASYEIYIFPKIYLELGGNYYPLINKVEGKDNFFQYVVGVNYWLGKD